MKRGKQNMKQKRNSFSNTLVIDIKEFCWRLLEQWKVIILVSTCIMVAFLGCMKFRNMRVKATEQKSQSNTVVQSAQEIVNALPDDEKTAVLCTYRLWKEKEQVGEYINTALIMKLDPSHSKRLRVSWGVDTIEQNTGIIQMSYVMGLQSDKCRKALLQASGLDADVEQINDLLLITYPNENDQDLICCDFFLTDNMLGKDVQTELNHQVESIHNDLQVSICEHQIQNYQSEIAIVSDDRILERQTEVLSYYANLNSQVNNLKSTFSSNQKDALTKLQEKENKGSIQEIEQIPSVSPVFSIHNIVIGLAIGVFIYICLFLLYVILSCRIISAKSMQEAPIRLLGELYTDNGGISKLIRDEKIWKHWHHKLFDEERETKRIANILISICQFKQLDSLLLMLSSNISNQQNAVIKDLSSQLKENDIEVEEIEVEKQNADQALLSIEGVVLVILGNKTKVREIDSILDRCCEYEKPILGSVYLE